MASTSQQQIVSQASAFFKFEVPSYNDFGGLSRVGDAISAAGTSISDSFWNENSGPNSAVAGLLGPSSKAPRLVPNQLAPIDVKSNFAWTSSKSDPARAETPYVLLTEKVVDRSSRLQNSMYSTASLLQSPLGAIVGGKAGAAIGGGIGSLIGGGVVGRGVGSVVGGVVGAASSTSIAEKLLPGDEYTNNLRAFSGLYSTTPTNFKYKLPFVKTQGIISKGVSQSWSEEGETFGDTMTRVSETLEDVGGAAGGGVLSKVAGLGSSAGLIGQAADVTNKAFSDINKSLFAAAYTETAKAFNYGGDSSFDISFYLFNNLTWADTVKNWHLVFALQYQNLPNRLNRLILTPSVIYEAVVPGYFYSMYTYISSLNVSFIGSTILMDMPIIKSDDSEDSERNASTGQSSPINSSIKVVIPEVYKVDIQFKSLVPESQNLLYEAMVQSRSNGFVPQPPPMGGIGQFGGGGVGLTPGQRPGSLGAVPLGF